MSSISKVLISTVCLQFNEPIIINSHLQVVKYLSNEVKYRNCICVAMITYYSKL